MQIYHLHSIYVIKYKKDDSNARRYLNMKVYKETQIIDIWQREKYIFTCICMYVGILQISVAEMYCL